jgi:hypothetical protein
MKLLVKCNIIKRKNRLSNDEEEELFWVLPIRIHPAEAEVTVGVQEELVSSFLFHEIKQ